MRTSVGKIDTYTHSPNKFLRRLNLKERERKSKIYFIVMFFMMTHDGALVKLDIFLLRDYKKFQGEVLMRQSALGVKWAYFLNLNLKQKVVKILKFYFIFKLGSL